MSSGYSAGVSDLCSSGRRPVVTPNGGYGSSFNPGLNLEQQFCYRSPLAGVVSDTDVQIRRPDLVGKRSLMEFQQQQQQSFSLQNQGLGFYLRSVKGRPNCERTSPVSTLSPIDLSAEASSISNSMNSRFGVPILQQNRMQAVNVTNRNVRNVFDGIPIPNLAQSRRLGNLGVNVLGNATEELEMSMMNHRLQELEKQLLDDEEDGEGVSAVTNSQWSETIQNLISPAGKPVSSPPTSSSSSCSSSSSASAPLALIDAAAAISDGKPEAAAEILKLVQPLGNTKGNSEQRLAAYMVHALKSRVYPTEYPPATAAELCGDEHAVSTHLLYEVSPCFNFALMAANLAIHEATTELGFEKIHVLDFDVGQLVQYTHLLHTLAAKKKFDNKPSAALRITAFGNNKKLQLAGDDLKALAARIGVPFKFEWRNLKPTDLCRETLKVQPDEALAVNFAFKLHTLPDESVTTENLRDDLLRRVKSLAPAAIAVVEQDINTNTAPLTARVRDACEYYGALFESLDATAARESVNRGRIEAALGRKLSNAIACEGADRVERCEVFGKWRARMNMAGFRTRTMSQAAAESLRAKINSVTRGGTGFTMMEESGGICFGWMGRTLTVMSVWR